MLRDNLREIESNFWKKILFKNGQNIRSKLEEIREFRSENGTNKNKKLYRFAYSRSNHF